MTIVAGGSLKFPGYRIDCRFQIGCATTEDYPSEETTSAAEREARDELARISDEVGRAWRCYTGSGHPFTRVRGFLGAGAPGTPVSDPIPWGKAHVYLFVRAETAPIAQKKLLADFLLSLSTDPGFRGRAPYHWSGMDKEGLSYVLSCPNWVSETIAAAALRGDELRAHAAAPEPPEDHHAERWFRANAVLRALDGAPFAGLLDVARRRPSIRPQEALLLFSTARHEPELPAVAALLGPADRAYFDAVLPK